MFHVLEKINWRWCRHHTVPLTHIRSTVSDGVCPSPRGGGVQPAQLPSKFATESVFENAKGISEHLQRDNFT